MTRTPLAAAAALALLAGCTSPTPAPSAAPTPSIAATSARPSTATPFASPTPTPTPTPTPSAASVAPSAARGAGKPGKITDIPVTTAVEWEPGDVVPGTEDNPDLAPLAVDGDPATAWRTDRYLQQFATPPAGLKPGVGLLVDLAGPTRVGEIRVTVDRLGTGIRIYGVPEGPFVSLDRAVELGEARLSRGENVIATGGPSTDGPSFTRILVWVWALPMPEAADVSEISVRGIPVSARGINNPR